MGSTATTSDVDAFVNAQISLTNAFKSISVKLDESEAARLQAGEELIAYKLSYATLNEQRSEESGTPFAVALVDADGAIFKREYIARGRDGGREMGILLLKRIIECVGRIDILVKIFLNTTGLRKVMIVSHSECDVG